MADALLSMVGKKLAEVAGRELSLFFGAKDELEKLRNTFESIQALLADAERRQAEDKSVKLWLSRLRGVAYDIDDLLDDLLISGPEEEEEEAEAEHDDDDDDDDDDDNDDDGDDDGRNKVLACLLSPCPALDHFVSRYNIARRITKIGKRLDQIDEDKKKCSFSSGSGGGQGQHTGRRPFAGSLIQEEMFGREKDEGEIMNRLVCGSSSENGQVHVIAIVGMAGQGKTTLARKIYNDSNLQQNFNLFSWVCVTDDFNVARVIKAILSYLKVDPPTDELSTLQKYLHDQLDGKRFLVVLDDIWNENEEKWNTLLATFTSGAPGSRILVTTRSLKVAKIMNAINSNCHELQCLSEDDSWRLFSSRAFAGRNDNDRSALQATGKEIVRKCGGVPLSVKVMGSAMNGKTSEEDWQKISKSKMWSLRDAEREIFPALWFSYDNLPSPQKQCFAYCSIFPKDTVMHKNQLVRLWVAQGFVHADGDREVENIAAEYFDDLLGWSLFQEVDDDLLGWSMSQGADDDRSSCKMHDLLHDLAEVITKHETSVYGGEKSNQSLNNVRHASFLPSKNDLNINLVSSCEAKTLRTLFLRRVDRIDTGLDNLFFHTTFLRALDFSYLQIKTLPKTIGKLKHLRYLDLSNSWIMELPNTIGKMKYLRYLVLSNSKLLELPNAIGKLKNLRYLDLGFSKLLVLPNAIGKLKYLTYLNLSGLEIVELPDSVRHLRHLNTLKLNNCWKLTKLPTSMGGMVRLRHLEFNNIHCLKHLPKVMGKMTSLRSLSKFIVGGEGGCEINELKHLNDLQGNLTIEHLERVPSRQEAMKAELCKKQNLHKLVMEMSSYDDEEVTTSSDRSNRDEEVTMSSGRSDRDEEVVVSRRYDAEMERMDGVLEGLCPHENLNELELNCNKRSSKLPSWLEDSSFAKLTKLKISGFVIQCEQNNLPGLGKLPALKHLEMNDIDVKKVGHEWYYGNSSDDIVTRGIKVVFPKLEILRFDNMPELVEWELILESDGDVEIMPHLSELSLQGCPKLERLPRHLVNAPLKNLELSFCQRLRGTGHYSGCYSFFSHLENFSLDGSGSRFIVGGEGGCKINELQQLDYLQGDLTIEHLERVPSSQEAMKAELCKKQNLHALVLKMSSYRDEEIATSYRSNRGEEVATSGRYDAEMEGIDDKLVLEMSSDKDEVVATSGRYEAEMKRMDGVLEGLRPHENLNELTLNCNNCNSNHPSREKDPFSRISRLPSWLEDSSFTKLTRLEINGFVNRCEQNNLPGLGMLPALTDLLMWNINVKRLGREWYYGNSSNDVVARGIKVVFPKLEELKLYDMRELEEWELMLESDRDVTIMPHLSYLRLENCPKLERLPRHLVNAPLTSLHLSACNRLKRTECSVSFLQLRKLTVARSGEFLSSGIPHLSKLEQLCLTGIRNETLSNEGWECMSILRELQIYFCRELKSLPDGLTLLPSLEVLKIYECNKIESLPEGLGQLKKLRSLMILSVRELICFPNSLAQLESLEYLHIVGSRKLKSLPEGLGQLKSLKHFEITSSENLESLPRSLVQLKKLESLTIGYLPAMNCLPNTIERLKSLKKFEIHGWKELESLPYWLKDLPLLQELKIRDCPLLSERHNKEEGDYWCKILQIPIIDIRDWDTKERILRQHDLMIQ